jgi:C-terminal processing protease CtpA/Prc
MSNQLEEADMKRNASLLAVALLLAGASGLVAGHKEKCNADPAECMAKMKAKMASQGWLGVEMDKSDDGKVTVTKVFPDSPAAAAGFQKGDVLVAVGGVSYYAKDEAEKKKLQKAWGGPGHAVTFTVKRAGEKKTLDATLGSVPPQMAKKWIDEHMKTHHADAKKKEKAKKS